MQSLPSKVRSVQRTYAKLDAEIAKMQSKTGLHCISGCGECCKKPDIEATPIEFLPLALELFDNNLAEQFLDELAQANGPTCHLFRPYVTNFGGLCSNYPHRGLICRLFGFTARITKEGQSELVTCKLIKAEQSVAYEAAVSSIKQGEKIPVMSHFYSRMANIDSNLNTFYPINVAMRKAIETVLHYYAYRKRRVNKKKS